MWRSEILHFIPERFVPNDNSLSTLLSLKAVNPDLAECCRLRMMTGYDEVVWQWDQNISKVAYFLSNKSWKISINCYAKIEMPLQI